MGFHVSLGERKLFRIARRQWSSTTENGGHNRVWGCLLGHVGIPTHSPIIQLCRSFVMLHVGLYRVV